MRGGARQYEPNCAAEFHDKQAEKNSLLAQMWRPRFAFYQERLAHTKLMSRIKNLRALVLAFTFLGPLACGVSVAADYPSRPIRLITPKPPGGPVNIATRVLSSKLTTSLGQPVVVDNKPGASQMISIDLLAKSAPDGCRL